MSHSNGAIAALWMTPKEVARHFGVNYSTVLRWIYLGKLDSSPNPGGDHRIRRADVEAFDKSKVKR